MVYVRKYQKKTYRKKRTYKKRTFPKVLSAAAPLPAAKKLMFKYSEAISINPPAGGAVGAYVFSANGIFDPNITGVGHQPLGFDQWCPTFYNHYVVVGAKCTARISSPNSTVAGGTLIAGIELVDNPTPFNLTVSGIMERPKTNYKMISNSATGRGMQMVSKNFSAKKFFRINDVIGDSTQRGTSATNPSEQAYFHVWVGAFDETTDIGATDIIVTIEYIVALLEPTQLVQS